MEFDEQAYLAANPDVAAAVATGAFSNAAQHYSMYGQYEGRDAGGATSGAQTNYYDSPSWVASQATQGDADVWGRSAGGTSMNNYFQSNPDVAKEYEKVKLAGGAVSPEDYAVYHYDNFGRFEGRGGVLPTGQTTFERQMGSAGGTFYDIYAGEPTTTNPGAFVNPIRGQYSSNIDKYQKDYGGRYAQVGPWGQFETDAQARAYAEANKGNIDSYMTGGKPSWIDSSKAAWGGSQAGNYNWQGSTQAGYRQPGGATTAPSGGSTFIGGGAPSGGSSFSSGGAPSLGFNLSNIAGPSQWDVSGNQTVANQLTALMTSDNPLLQQARARALQQSNARGLSNSSIAQTAGDAAAYDAMLQVAKQDASTNATAAQSNTAAQNQFNTDYNAFLRNGYMADFNLSANEWAAQQEFARQQELARLQAELSNSSTATQTSTNMRQGYINALNQARTDWSDKYAALMADPNMSPENKQAAIKGLATSYNTQIKQYTGLLGWDYASWDIEYDDTDPTASTPAPAAATPVGIQGSSNY